MAFKMKGFSGFGNSPIKKEPIDLTKNTPEQNKKLMQEYRDKNMRRTRPIPGGKIKTKHLGYDPEGSITEGIKSLDKKLIRFFK